MMDIDRGKLIQFMMKYFDDEEIVMLCLVEFREVHGNFAAGMTKRQKVLNLITWCDRRLETDKLLAALQQEREKPFREWFGQQKQQEVRDKPAVTDESAYSKRVEKYREILAEQTPPAHEVRRKDTQIHPITGKVMVRIPAGEFLYGEKKEKVTLPEYWIDKTPVTNAEYGGFVTVTNQQPPSHWKGNTPPKDLGDHPVTHISWDDAVAYTNWANCRLPTEQEWEKAARGTDGRIYPWGNEWRKNHCNSKESDFRGATNIGRFSPHGNSPYGCIDISGNVWEWTKGKAVRGGSWVESLDYARVISRLDNRFPYSRRAHLGFRVVALVAMNGRQISRL